MKIYLNIIFSLQRHRRVKKNCNLNGCKRGNNFEHK